MKLREMALFRHLCSLYQTLILISLGKAGLDEALSIASHLSRFRSSSYWDRISSLLEELHASHMERALSLTESLLDDLSRRLSMEEKLLALFYVNHFIPL